MLRNIEEMLRLLEALLSRGIPVLRHGKYVIELGNSYRKAAISDFGFRSADCFGGCRTMIRRHHIRLRRQILMEHAPRAVYVNAVVCDEPASRRFSVSFRSEVLSRRADGRKHRISSLHRVFVRNPRIGAGS